MSQATSAPRPVDERRTTNPVRFVTAASLFDGHDAAINIMRRMLQSQGAEVVHLGHDRSVEAVVLAAIQEDVQGIAISSYQGGHVEYFSYLVDRLTELGAGTSRSSAAAAASSSRTRSRCWLPTGVRIFSPEDGQRLGLAGMINVADPRVRRRPRRPRPRRRARCSPATTARSPGPSPCSRPAASATSSGAGILRRGRAEPAPGPRHHRYRRLRQVQSLTDELVRRLRIDQEDKLRIAVLAVDPTRRRGGGALLGDRIRMNSIDCRRGRSSARWPPAGASACPDNLGDVVAACKAAGFDLVIVETPGIGQGDAAIIPLVDVSLYVMTPEFGAASQLEKIDMLDFADVVAINKFERRGAEDARRDVGRQLVRNREAFGVAGRTCRSSAPSAARFDDDGVTALVPVPAGPARRPRPGRRRAGVLRPGRRQGFHRAHHRGARRPGALPRRGRRRRPRLPPRDHGPGRARPAAPAPPHRAHMLVGPGQRRRADRRAASPPSTAELLPEVRRAAERVAGRRRRVRGRRARRTWSAATRSAPSCARTTLSGSSIPRVAAARTRRTTARCSRSCAGENLPGRFPFTAGVFPFKREGEAPARMFAGEGDAFRTNRRFQLLSQGQAATRLSTAFDSVTLYGRDPDQRRTSTARSGPPASRSPRSTT